MNTNINNEEVLYITNEGKKITKEMFEIYDKNSYVREVGCNLGIWLDGVVVGDPSVFEKLCQEMSRVHDQKSLNNVEFVMDEFIKKHLDVDGICSYPRTDECNLVTQLIDEMQFKFKKHQMWDVNKYFITLADFPNFGNWYVSIVPDNDQSIARLCADNILSNFDDDDEQDLNIDEFYNLSIWLYEHKNDFQYLNKFLGIVDKIENEASLKDALQKFDDELGYNDEVKPTKEFFFIEEIFNTLIEKMKFCNNFYIADYLIDRRSANEFTSKDCREYDVIICNRDDFKKKTG